MINNMQNVLKVVTETLKMNLILVLLLLDSDMVIAFFLANNNAINSPNALLISHVPNLANSDKIVSPFTKPIRYCKIYTL